MAQDENMSSKWLLLTMKKGVISCIPYDKMDGKYLADFLGEHLIRWRRKLEKLGAYGCRMATPHKTVL